MILLSLLGEQPIPNLMPLWQTGHPYQAVRFVVSDTTLPIAENLMEIIPQDPILKNITILPPIHITPYHLAQARLRLTDALVKYQLNGEPAAVNITGGTKIMSLAAMQAAQTTATPMIYVNTQGEEIILYNPDGSEKERIPLKVNISVQQYLSAHGIELSDHPNFYPKAQRPFAPPKAGDLLEERVKLRLTQSGIFDDVRHSIYIRRKDRPQVHNELDIAVTLNGKLAVCSCKSGKNVHNDAIYELASLSSRESIGLYCGKVLVIDQPEIKDAVRNRSRITQVHLVYGEKINQIEQTVCSALGINPKRRDYQ